MANARRTLQILRFAMLFSIAIYGLMVERLPSTAHGKPIVCYIAALVVAWVLFGLFRFHEKFVKGSEAVLATNPADTGAQKRWQTGYIITYAFSEAIALYGLMLHFMGFDATKVAPFLIAGFLLILFYSPKLPTASRS